MSGTDRELASETRTAVAPVEFVLAPEAPPTGIDPFFAELLNEEKFTTAKQIQAEEQPSGSDHFSILEAQLYPGFASIPEQYKADHPRNKFFSEVTTNHSLTELPILNERVRARLGLAMAKGLEQGEDFALITSDTDQLKRLNDLLGRKTGDYGILNNAVEIIRVISESEFGNDMFVFAAGASPDEVTIFVRNLNPDKIKQLQAAVNKRNETQREFHDIPVKQKDGTTKMENGVFSGSAGMASSVDDIAVNEVLRFRELVKQRRAEGEAVTPAYILFDLLREESDEIAHEIKAKHERDTFPDVQTFLEDLSSVEADSALMANAGKRIGPQLYAATTALAKLRGIEDALRMPPEDRDGERARLLENIKQFTEG